MSRKQSVQVHKSKGSISIEDPEPGGFAHFLKTNCRNGIVFHHSREEIKSAFLRNTPDSYNEHCKMTFRIILKFMGDICDYRSAVHNTHQPNYGSIMSRVSHVLKISLGETTDERDTSEIVNKHVKTGTMRVIHNNMMKRKSITTEKTIFNDLSLEDSIITPLEQVHFILAFGILDSKMRDEIYCQLIKQLISNRYDKSIVNGWMLLRMLCFCFLPSSAEVYSHLITFINEGPPMYSVTCSKALQRMQQNGYRQQPPTYTEIQALLERKILSFPVFLMNGKSVSLIADSSSTVSEICLDIKEKIGLMNSFGFAVSLAIDEQVTSFGNGDDLIFDLISLCEQIYRDNLPKSTSSSVPWKLFYRKEIFTPWSDDLCDSVANSLIYTQIARGLLLGEYRCHKNSDLSKLVAQQCCIDFGMVINEAELLEVIEAYVPSFHIKGEYNVKRWKNEILKAYDDIFRQRELISEESIKSEIIEYARENWAYSFSRVYYITSSNWKDEELKFVVNNKVLSILSNNNIVHQAKYYEIEAIEYKGGIEITMYYLRGFIITIQTESAKDLHHLLNYILEDLKRRAKFALARNEIQGNAPDMLTAKRGDLIELDSKYQDKNDMLKGTNAANNSTGIMMKSSIIIMATLEKPESSFLEILNKILQVKKFGSHSPNEN